MDNYTTKDITKILAKEITTGKYKSNEKLPSEAQLSIKYNISRAITNKVFSNLKEMDLVYSIAHQGYFVAEWFSGITQPYHLQYNTDKCIITEGDASLAFKEFLLDKNITIKGDIYHKEMFAKNKLVVISEIWCSNFLKLSQNFSIKNSLTDFMNSKNSLVSMTRFVHFEKDDKMNNYPQLVEYKIYYGEDEIEAISRNLISHDVFLQSKKERPF